MKFCSRLGAGEGRGSGLFSVILCQNVDLKVSIFWARGGGSDPVDTSPPFPYTLPLLEYAWLLTNWMYLMYHHVTPQMMKMKTQPKFISIWRVLSVGMIEYTCSSCAVGAHSIAVIQSVFWWFIHNICFSQMLVNHKNN